MSGTGEAEQHPRFEEIGRQRLYEHAYRELSRAVTGIMPLPSPPSEADFIDSVLDYIRDKRDDLYKAICIDFDYCAKRKKHGKNVLILEGIIGIIAAIGDVALGGVASATWLVTSGVLDKLCGCAE